MKHKKKTLAVIPARGGSKGLPGKNIMQLCGKPLIAWSIECALRCARIDKVLVTTDDPEIADISRLYNAEVPFLRPEELAGDDATTIDAVFHAIGWLEEKQAYKPDQILLLQPTSPLRIEGDILRSLHMLDGEGVKAVVSVCQTDHHPWWSNTLPESGNMKDFLPKDIINTRRQDLPAYYRLNGAIYLAEIDYLHQCNGFMGPKTLAYKMPQDRSIDIDSELDFQMAVWFKRKQGNQ